MINVDCNAIAVIAVMLFQPCPIAINGDNSEHRGIDSVEPNFLTQVQAVPAAILNPVLRINEGERLTVIGSEQHSGELDRLNLIRVREDPNSGLQFRLFSASNFHRRYLRLTIPL